MSFIKNDCIKENSFEIHEYHPISLKVSNTQQHRFNRENGKKRKKEKKSKEKLKSQTFSLNTTTEFPHLTNRLVYPCRFRNVHIVFY